MPATVVPTAPVSGPRSGRLVVVDAEHITVGRISQPARPPRSWVGAWETSVATGPVR